MGLGKENKFIKPFVKYCLTSKVLLERKNRSWLPRLVKAQHIVKILSNWSFKAIRSLSLKILKCFTLTTSFSICLQAFATLKVALQFLLENLFLYVKNVKSFVCLEFSPNRSFSAIPEVSVIERLQLGAKFPTSMVSCSRFFWILNYSDHRSVWTVNLLHTKSLHNPLDHKA